MDFFRKQEQARRQTGWLLLYLLLAILAISVCTYFAVYIAIYVAERNEDSKFLLKLWWHREAFYSVLILTCILIAISSLYKIAQLGRGGKAVAELLGGIPVASNTTDLKEKRLLNVVEEMALAAGMGVPPVYLLPKEAGINAFAAGFSPNDAVIGVTQGLLDHLNREEMQGVIAHEFSHIFNGDMRINIRLMGILHGILVLSLLGAIVARGEKNPLLLLGILLYALGYIGVFFGRLIKAAVSRQREFLADASGVQYTRNPLGLAGALKKIGSLKEHSRIQNSQAEEASHFFFSAALRNKLANAWSTHPPLKERILRLDPTFRGEVEAPREREGIPLGIPAMSNLPSDFSPEDIVARVGHVQAEHLQLAKAFLQSIPEGLRAGIREPFEARSLVYALLLSKDAAILSQQLDMLRAHSSGIEAILPENIQKIHEQMEQTRRLPLLDAALPALRSLSDAQYRRFRENVTRLIEADQKLDLFELVLKRVLVRHLDPYFQSTRVAKIRFRRWQGLEDDVMVLLAGLAQAGSVDETEARRSFAAGCAKITDAIPNPVYPAQEKLLNNLLDASLDRLSHSSLEMRRQILEACASVVFADGNATILEKEIFRGIADAFDCPMPPFS